MRFLTVSDDLIDAYIQTVLSAIAIDKMAKKIFSAEGNTCTLTHAWSYTHTLHIHCTCTARTHTCHIISHPITSHSCRQCPSILRHNGDSFWVCHQLALHVLYVLLFFFPVGSVVWRHFDTTFAVLLLFTKLLANFFLKKKKLKIVSKSSKWSRCSDACVAEVVIVFNFSLLRGLAV